jgi:nitroreductase
LNEALRTGETLKANETLKTIAARYSCRSYKDQTPDDAVLGAIAKAAAAAPSGMNQQRWRVVVLKNKALMSEIEEEGLRVLASLPDSSAYDRIQSRGGKLFYNAPCMIFVPIWPAGNLDCGIVCQNIALAAVSLGLGSVICAMAGLAFRDKGAFFAKKLGFPEGYEFGCSVLLGYAKTDGEPHEPDLSKISFIE